MVRLLGKGAFAEAYLAEDSAGLCFACKVSGRAELLEREAGFQRETDHPLFPVFFDFWRESGKGFLLMEYVPGESLENLIRREGALPVKKVAEIGRQLAEGLGYLHERKEPLLFRDVKPANVMLTPEGSVRLLDFGCVCPQGRNTDRAGTPGFGAPEQFEPGWVQSAADVYGLGRTLQEAAGGNCRGLLKRITDRCTARSPADRLQNMRETGELLKLCAGGTAVRPSERQKAVLQGKIRVVKDICLR